MGWLIITIVILAACTTLAVLNENRGWDNMAIDVCSTAGAFCSLLVSVVLIVCIAQHNREGRAKIEEYSNTVELIQELKVPSDAVTEKIFDLNETIIKNRVHANSFWTKGLYSKKVGALPLLDLPEVMTELPIDYD